MNGGDADLSDLANKQNLYTPYGIHNSNCIVNNVVNKSACLRIFHSGYKMKDSNSYTVEISILKPIKQQLIMYLWTCHMYIL